MGYTQKQIDPNINENGTATIIFFSFFIETKMDLTKKKRVTLRSEKAHHMYSAITFSVASEMLRLIRSESRDISTQEENKKLIRDTSALIYLYTDSCSCTRLSRDVNIGAKSIQGLHTVIIPWGTWLNIRVTAPFFFFFLIN